MLHKATLEELSEIQKGFKLYVDEGHFTYIRHDYIVRSIEAKEVFYDNGVIAIIRQMKRAGRIGNFRYGAGAWHIHKFLSLDKKNTVAPFVFMRNFLDEYVKCGLVFCTVHISNLLSIGFCKAIGFKVVGDISWSDGTIPGVVLALNRSEGFISQLC